MSIPEHVEARSTPEPNTGCWLWLRGMGNYAQIDFEGRRESVPRLILGLQPGDGLLACHRCDNPGCVNPQHLFVGTVRDNVHDMMRKGRMVNPCADKTHCKNNHPFDETNTRIAPSGQRVCKACEREAHRGYRASGRRKELRRLRAARSGRTQV